MDNAEMIAIANGLKKRKKPRSHDDLITFVEEATGDLERIIEALDAMREKTDELKERISDAGDAETVKEYKEDHADDIEILIDELVEVLTNVDM